MFCPIVTEWCMLTQVISLSVSEHFLINVDAAMIKNHELIMNNDE